MQVCKNPQLPTPNAGSIAATGATEPTAVCGTARATTGAEAGGAEAACAAPTPKKHVVSATTTIKAVRLIFLFPLFVAWMIVVATVMFIPNVRNCPQ